jgi:hypothetical protein
MSITNLNLVKNYQNNVRIVRKLLIIRNCSEKKIVKHVKIGGRVLKNKEENLRPAFFYSLRRL